MPSGKPVFNNDKGVQSLTWMKQTIDDGLTNPSSVSSDENAVEADFLAGKSAFAVNWLFQYSDSNDATKSQIVGQGGFRPHARLRLGANAAGIKRFQRGWLQLICHHGDHALSRSDLEIPDLSCQQRDADQVFG